MDDANFLPNDLVECQRLVLAAFQEATQRERRVADAERQVAELSRVLDQTAASHEELIQKHQATVDELNALKRWAYGRRRERIVEGDGQQHLFDLAPPDETQTPASAQEPRQQIAGHTRRRRRELDLSRLPHHRHELDLPPEEKTCRCCGRAKDRIGEDVTKILEHVPSKLEVHEYVRPSTPAAIAKTAW